MRGVAALAVALGALGAATPALAQAAAPAFADGNGLRVVSEHALDARLLALTLATPLLPAATNLRILLPAGYAAEPARRYPVLYLFHGTSGGADDWTTLGDAERATAGQPLIVVMPDIALGRNGGGWCTDSYNGGAGGPPAWETFHIGDLVPWVDANLRTIATRGGRAIAGLSQGGFCSMSYAARHPDLFAIAASYSGAPDIAYDPQAQLLAAPVIEATAFGLDGVPADSFFGSPLTEQINWADHDPATLAPNLRDTKLLIYSGNGLPGPLDGPIRNPGVTAVESGVHELSMLFHQRLDSLGIPSTYVDYGPGTHTWPYWARDLRETIGPIMAAFAAAPAPPASVTYTTAEPRYSVYGWTVAMHRGAKEFSTLKRASAAGFSLAGSGSATVTTPPAFAPGITYRTSLGAARADARGRLTLDLPLGPANPAQQDTLGASTTVYSRSVAITATPPPARPRPCTSRRAITLHVRGLRDVRVRVRGGRRVRVRRGHAVIRLGGQPPGAVVVVITGLGRGGRRVRAVRTFHTCEARGT